MKDSIEEQLRQLRPARLPKELQARLAQPPPAETKVVRFPAWRLAAGLAAAACVALAVFLNQGGEVKGPPQIVMSQFPGGELIAERTVAVVNDGGQRAWEIVETERVEAQTLIADVGGYVALTQQIRHYRTPRDIHID